MQDDPEGALQDYNRALAIEPAEPDALLNRGILRYELGDPAGSLEDFTRLLGLLPGSANAYIGRGQARYALGHLSGALEDLNRAVSLDPANASAHYYRGLTLRNGGNLSDALRDFVHARRLKTSETAECEAPAFELGQCWGYRTRKGEETSRLWVFGLTSGPTQQVVNVTLTNLRLGSEWPDSSQSSIHHLPISALALNESITQIDTNPPNIPGDLDSFGYLHWLEEFGAGRAGAWEMPVADIIQSVQEANR